MAKFLKLVGVHHRREGGVEVAYGPKSIIEATEEELRKFDPNLNTWRLIEESPKEPEPVEINLAVQRIEGSKEFNVVNTVTGKPINDVPLNRKDAFALVKNPALQVVTPTVTE